MASLAGMLKARGAVVTGSDQNVYPPMSTQLAELGIEVMQGYKPENLNVNPDCVIIGNAMSRGNLEVEEVLNRKLLYASQAETVKEEFIRGRRSLVVAGTHGKTTTTSIATWVMECGGLNPSFLVGGVVQNFGNSFRVTDSDCFIIEGDEYDTAYFDKGAKFMHYLPEIAIVNNIEFDHADIYKDLDAIKFAFSRLMNLVPGNGRLIVCWDCPNTREVVNKFGEKLFTKLETFGTSEEAKWRVRDIDFSGDMTRFKVYCANVFWGEFETPLIGEFNAKNCLSVIIAADAWGVSKEQIAHALKTFKSVKRRMEVRGIERGVTVIDDFAHHPTAVRETLLALRNKYREQRLIAVFEPRSNTSRLATFQEPYAQAFQHADYVIITNVFNPTNVYGGTTLLDTNELTQQIAETAKPAFCLKDADEIITHLSPQLKTGDVVAIMSNGAFGGIHEKLLAVLRLN